MGLVASSVVMTVIVLNIHHQPIKSRRLVYMLREGAPFLFLARLLCVGRPVKTPKKFSKLNSHAYQMQPMSLLNGSITKQDRINIKRLSETFSAKNNSMANAQHIQLFQNTMKESLSDLAHSFTDLNYDYSSLNSNFNGDVKSQSPKHYSKQVNKAKVDGSENNTFAKTINNNTTKQPGLVG